MPKSQITETDFVQNIERPGKRFYFADLGEELNRFVDRELEQIVNRFAVQFDFQDVRLKTFALAFGATHIEIAQELHLDLLEPCSRTTLTTAAAGVERERARREPLRHRFRLRSEQFTDAIVKAKIENRRGARRAREQRLIDHHDFTDAMRSAD